MVIVFSFIPFIYLLLYGPWLLIFAFPFNPEHKLFVGMLPKNVSEVEVSTLFSKYGTVKDLQILRGSQQTSKGNFSPQGWFIPRESLKYTGPQLVNEFTMSFSFWQAVHS